MQPDGNNLDTAALARKSVLHKCVLVNVLANATNQTRAIFSVLLRTPSSNTAIFRTYDKYQNVWW